MVSHKTNHCTMFCWCVGGLGAGSGSSGPRQWWVCWCGSPESSQTRFSHPQILMQSQDETVLGPWPPLLSLTPLGEPGNGTGPAGSFLSMAGPCLLQLPATLLPQPLQLLSESQRNLAIPEGPAVVLKGHCLSHSSSCPASPQPSLSTRQRGQVPWLSTTGSSKAAWLGTFW